MPISSGSIKYYRNIMKDWKLEKTQEVFLHAEGSQASLLLQDVVLTLLLARRKVWIILLLLVIVPTLSSPWCQQHQGENSVFPQHSFLIQSPIRDKQWCNFHWAWEAVFLSALRQQHHDSRQEDFDPSLRGEGLGMRCVGWVPDMEPDVAASWLKDSWGAQRLGTPMRQQLQEEPQTLQ